MAAAGKYPTPSEIRTIFHPLSQPGQQSAFLYHVADDVNWTIQGHSPMQGVYTSKAAFTTSTLAVLGARVLTSPLRLAVTNVTGGGPESPWAAVELRAIDAVCRNGLTYDMTYCWVVRFDEGRRVVEVRAYLDTDLLGRALAGNPG